MAPEAIIVIISLTMILKLENDIGFESHCVYKHGTEILSYELLRLKYNHNYALPEDYRMRPYRYSLKNAPPVQGNAIFFLKIVKKIFLSPNFLANSENCCIFAV